MCPTLLNGPQVVEKMWMLAFQFVFTGLYLQISTCYPACSLHGLFANCAQRHHYWVPALPTNITQLFLDRNYISEINSTSLRPYDQLIRLDLGSQKVRLVIRSNSFLRQRKLTQLILGDNIGLRLEPRAFAGLFNLQHLFLDHCKLTESILEESYLQPLLSLEALDLSGNEITRLRPAQFFSKLRKFVELKLKLNQIDRLCEEDLVGFQGKYFNFLSLNSNKLYSTHTGGFDWEACGNPFRGMAFYILDLSTNSFDTHRLRQFFKAIEGTPITHIILSGHIGKDFSYDNLRDPDKSTFEGLMNSSVNILDLSKNRVYALQREVFSPLKDAIAIDVSENKINQIDRNAFSGLQRNLQMLNLSFNLLGEIRDYTFTHLTNLTVLDLSHNHIGVLVHQAFSDLPKLQILDLSGNSLRDLEIHVALPNLQFLVLKDNKLKSLNNIINFGTSLIFVDVRDNRLTNLEEVYVILSHFNQLQHFFFGGNFIKWCTLNQIFTISPNNSLQVLDLSDSSLYLIWTYGKCLDLFDHLENLYTLNLKFNSIATLPHGIFSGLRSIEFIDLSFNALKYLQPGVFPDSLKRLNLANNFLTSPNPATFQSLSVLNLAINQFYCDCHLESFLTWLNETNVSFPNPVEEYRCEFPEAVHNLPLLDYYMIIEPCDEDDENSVQHLRFALFSLSALLITTVNLISAVYARLRGQVFIIYKKIVGRVLEGPKPAPPMDEMQYDAFLCFSDRDFGWVEAALLKKLDNQFSEDNILSFCFEARDFLPGQDHLSNIRDAIWGSRKTVCIVSKEFLQDCWCLEAFTLAQGRMLEELTNGLIMLVVGKVAHYQLMKYNAIRAFVQKRQYLTWPEDPQDLEWFYERLVSQVLKDTKTKKLAEDKPAQPNVQPQNEDIIELEDIK
uniref:Toll-like receptor 5 n=1 Tax=Sillago sinica TaxID=907714 RepID=A0A5J6SC00_9TELE|nr:toll-like receptor 5 [Sillago sinica]